MAERKRTKGQEEFEDTKGVIRIVYRRRTDNTMAERKRTKGQEEIEETKGAIRIRISKKNRQHNGQKKKDTRTKNDLQNIHIKKDRSNTNPTKHLE